MLISLSGVPGSGKTTLARELARLTGAVHLEIDSIERVVASSLADGQSSYRVAYSVGQAVAADNLRVGRTVIADCVNPTLQTRDEWLAVAKAAGVLAFEVEVTCSDPTVHEGRLPLGVRREGVPTRSQVITRHYQPWGRAHLIVDTAARPVEESVATIRRALPLLG